MTQLNTIERLMRYTKISIAAIRCPDNEHRLKELIVCIDNQKILGILGTCEETEEAITVEVPDCYIYNHKGNEFPFGTYLANLAIALLQGSDAAIRAALTRLDRVLSQLGLRYKWSDGIKNVLNGGVLTIPKYLENNQYVRPPRAPREDHLSLSNEYETSNVVCYPATMQLTACAFFKKEKDSQGLQLLDQSPQKLCLIDGQVKQNEQQLALVVLVGAGDICEKNQVQGGEKPSEQVALPLNELEKSELSEHLRKILEDKEQAHGTLLQGFAFVSEEKGKVVVFWELDVQAVTNAFARKPHKADPNWLILAQAFVRADPQLADELRRDLVKRVPWSEPYVAWLSSIK